MKTASQRSALVLTLFLAAAAVAFSLPALPSSPPQSSSAAASASSRKRLSADDITLLLIGGASPQKMIVIIHQRGVDFALNPDLVKQFYQDGATDSVIDALQRASEALAQPSAGAPAPAQPPAARPAPAPSSPTPPPAPSTQPVA
ncbi:MAG: hypothetical protein ACRD06_08600, partial [Terriglobia bacterium]